MQSEKRPPLNDRFVPAIAGVVLILSQLASINIALILTILFPALILSAFLGYIKWITIFYSLVSFLGILVLLNLIQQSKIGMTGRILDISGKPVENLELSLINSSQPPKREVTDENGQFVFKYVDLGDGEYSIILQDQFIHEAIIPYGLRIISSNIFTAHIDIGTFKVNLEPENEVPEFEETLVPQPTLSPTATTNSTLIAPTYIPTSIATTHGRTPISIENAGNVKFLNTLPIGSHTSTIRALSFSPDGRYLASAGSDAEIVIWDVEGGQVVRNLDGHIDWVNDLAYTSDGKIIVSVSGDDGSNNNDFSLRVWNIQTGSYIIDPILRSSRILTVAINPINEQHVAIGLNNGNLEIWNIENGNSINSISNPHNSAIRTIEYSNDGRFLATGGGDSIVKIWDANTLVFITEFTAHGGEGIEDLAFHPSAGIIAVGTSNGAVRIWDIFSGAAKAPFAGDVVWDVEFSKDGMFLIIGTNNTVTYIWDWEKDIVLKRLEGSTAPIRSVAVSPDNSLIVTGSQENDNRIRFWGIEEQNSD